MWRAPKFPQDSPQQITTDGVKSICKVDEGDKNVKMFLRTFILEKPRNENHISSVTRVTKATLRFQYLCVNDKCQKTDPHYTCQYFACDREKGDAFVWLSQYHIIVFGTTCFLTYVVHTVVSESLFGIGTSKPFLSYSCRTLNRFSAYLSYSSDRDGKNSKWLSHWIENHYDGESL